MASGLLRLAGLGLELFGEGSALAAEAGGAAAAGAEVGAASGAAGAEVAGVGAETAVAGEVSSASGVKGVAQGALGFALGEGLIDEVKDLAGDVKNAVVGLYNQRLNMWNNISSYFGGGNASTDHKNEIFGAQIIDDNSILYNSTAATGNQLTFRNYDEDDDRLMMKRTRKGITKTYPPAFRQGNQSEFDIKKMYKSDQPHRNNNMDGLDMTIIKEPHGSTRRKINHKGENVVDNHLEMTIGAQIAGVENIHGAVGPIYWGVLPDLSYQNDEGHDGSARLTMI